jgi:hypothetical protein
LCRSIAQQASVGRHDSGRHFPAWRCAPGGCLLEGFAAEPTLPTLTTYVINVVKMAMFQKKPVPVYLRGIPAEVVREAKAQAARRGITLAGFVADTLARALHEAPPPVAAPAADASSGVGAQDLDAEVRWFERNRKQIERRYAGQFVAIVEQRVVDHDQTFEALAERIFKMRGPRDTFMPKVTAGPRSVRLRSPQLRRAK